MVFSKALTFVLAGAAAWVDAASHNLLDAGVVSESDARRSLEAELSATDFIRLKDLEDTLRTTFHALPKDDNGNLGHQAVRYALHRMFIQRHGWFIKGLEPGSEKSAAAADAKREWVPSYLQGMLESKLGNRGASLHDLAAFAASLEDLIDSEARGRLGAAYDMMGLPRDTPISQEDALQAVKIYYISFLESGNFSADSRWEVEQKARLFAQRYTDWDAADHWMQDLVGSTFRAKDAAGGSFGFDEVARMVEDIGENYYKFNDDECRQLKGILGSLEGIKAGRVRLPFFYQKGLHSHWQFNEKKDYLRVLGALDDSEESAPQVIVPNYVMARPNCLEASSLYAICCRNECEDLMGTLESQIGTHTAKPQRIAELVSKMTSNSVKSPRELPPSLLSRLDEVASSNGGSVPLHGRLFAQWMHHAFPRECPYPHEAGANPQTPDEWMASQGEGAQEMTREQLLKEVEADQCASGLASGKLPRPEDCGSASGHDLPWVPREELLVSAPHSNSEGSQQAQTAAALVASSAGDRLLPFLDIAVILGLIVFLSFQLHQAGHGLGSFKVKDDRSEKLGHGKVTVDWRAVFALMGLAAVAFLLDMLDGIVLGCAMIGSIGSIAIRHFAAGDSPPPCGKDDYYCNNHV